MDIGLITVPPITTKKKHDRIFPFSASLNYGLLSLASHLAHHGFSSKIYDSKEWQAGVAVKRTLAWIEENRPHCVGLSCISGFSYPAFKIIVREIRKTFPTIPIIAGGKDHLALIAKNAMEECPEIDVIILGEGELSIVAIMKKGISRDNIDDLNDIPNVYLRRNRPKQGDQKKCYLEIDKFIPLDFNLYENFAIYPPCIEVGRGCPYGCSFCPNDRKKILKKDPCAIVDEAKTLSDLYKSENLRLYFQTPMFLMSDKELLKLANCREAIGSFFEWRTQTRVDYLRPERLALLGKAGARVIDLGLESGSTEMLIAMKKTRAPVEYLSAASKILHAAKTSQVKIKLNILFYAGERRETLLETFRFLDNHADIGWILSAYPLMIYPGTSLEKDITPILNKHGGSIEQDAEWKERHLAPVNPSGEFSYQKMQHIGIMFGKAFQTSDDYFNERKYGYYRPDVSYGDFLDFLKNIDVEDLPFSTNKEDMHKNRHTLKSLLEDKNANSANWCKLHR